MDKCKTGLGYNVVPPPYTGNFMPLKPDSVYPSLDDFVDVDKSVNYEEINGGFVAFGGNSKGWKITRKGQIRNDFKLTNESHVLLKVSRKDNMYNVDLKNVGPQRGLTCLFAKATSDESTLWHRRLGHFCEMKGIKRKFSVARTLQQNGVAEMKNKTLIEAARTMLANLKLPTTFWAEVVNTACYVQNRVLVIKPHNKTPYKLFLGRKHALSFMRPFGCPVTILNTIDRLGKFDGKADEEFFVRYSTNSKAFRIFNNRTRIVEENLHVKFSENTPNIAGSGPNWIFDIDALTKSMNYKPVVAGNQSNGSAGTKACDNVGKTRVKTVSAKDYILLPFWTKDPLFSSSSKDSHGARFKPSREEEKKNVKDPGNEDNEVPSTEEPRVNQEKDENVNNTNNVNTISPADNVAGIEDNDVDENIVYGCVDDPNIPTSEEISRFGDAEDGDSKADINNLDTYFQISHVPTIRIHKDHPLNQVIGDLIKVIRLFLSYALFKDFVVYQMDVNSAFLYGKIEKEVYVCQPPGFEDPNFPDRFYKVEKALMDCIKLPVLASTPMETHKTLLKDEKGEDYPKDLPFNLVAYTDNDYARASLDRKSITGGCQFLGCRLNSWQCKKQTMVAYSMIEAEEECLEWNGKADEDEIGTSAHNLNVFAINLLKSDGTIYHSSCTNTPQQNGVAERKHPHLVETIVSFLLFVDVSSVFWGETEVVWNFPGYSSLHVFGCTCFVLKPHVERTKLFEKFILCVFMGYGVSKKGYRCYDPVGQKLYTSCHFDFLEHIPYYSVLASSHNMTQSELIRIDPSEEPIPIVTPITPEPALKPTTTTETPPVIISEATPTVTQPPSMTTQSSFEVASVPPLNVQPTRIRKSTRKDDFVYSCYSNSFSLFIAFVHHLHESESYRESVCDPFWQVAMAEELAALHQTRSWDLVPFPVGKRAIGFHWVYKIKTKSNGSIERYKARLVSKGYAQEFGIDYESDVKNAFLNGDLNEEVFMKPLLGVSHKPREGCKLRKGLYGLKQAPRAWYEKFTSLRFVSSHHDSALFVKQSSVGHILLSLYVDGMILTGDYYVGIESMKLKLAHRFAMKDLSLLCYFLRIEVASSPKGYLLSQSNYIGDLLDCPKITNKMVGDIPIDSKEKYTLTDGDPLPEPSLYQNIVGSLVYLIVTYLDIYLPSSYCQSICFGSNNGSLGCYFAYSQKTKKQDVISKSFTEAEYRAMAVTASEIVWLRWLLVEMGVRISHSTMLHCDSYSSILIVPATTTVAFERCMNELKTLSVRAHDWLNKILAEHWSMAYFLGGRDIPVITLLEYIWEYCMKRTVNVQAVIGKCDGPLTPTATRILEYIKKQAAFMTIQCNAWIKYQLSRAGTSGGVFGNQGQSSGSQAVVSQADMVGSQEFGSQADMVGS
uniref:Integrase catalytic domain-containing protein n=1 Tax=Tanacetum cinerariifolium TaxID=118510 RepID=A0A699GMI8_TANCI|nr:hypothetical protein [Tanacetum cinerariifolium]